MKHSGNETISYHEHEDSPNIQACSSTDCTGLIPALPENEDQLEAYEELYPFLADGIKLSRRNQ